MDLPDIEIDISTLNDTDRIVEAIIAVADSPVREDILIDILRENAGGESHMRKTAIRADLENSIMKLNALYKGLGHSFRIEKLAGGFRMMTLPEYDLCIRKYLQPIRQQRLSKPAIETLAIVAYRQPTPKSEVERIRGVAADGVLHTLLDRRLIKISGRANGPGRPLLYSTTDQFLEYFGLNHLSDLPGEKEIEMLLGEPKSSPLGILVVKRGEEGSESEVAMTEISESFVVTPAEKIAGSHEGQQPLTAQSHPQSENTN